jgi:glutamate decarboxylase
VSFVRSADDDARIKFAGPGLSRSGNTGTALVDYHPPSELQKLLNISIPLSGQGSDGLIQAIKTTMQYSVNTWNRGFMDKLYASTDAPSLAAELILATLNTNVHVYAVSPALTTIEKHVTRALASLFGLTYEHSGGISVQGGAASNYTSMLIARNTKFPDVKSKGITSLLKPLAIFTSAEAHYSVSTAAASLGLGADSVWSVPVDSHGRMNVSLLQEQVERAIASGSEPFYCSATAGTTVRGAYDPLASIAKVCQTYNLWFHVDAAWGGPAIFSSKHKWKLEGSHLADSIACNPHKMMGVALTCSFLLGKDLRKFYAANSLTAGYLFHEDSDAVALTSGAPRELPAASEIYDLASLTPQCGRRGDSLKLYLCWVYHGSDGFESQIDSAFAASAYMASQISKRKDMALISENPPPCCQCCFYYQGEAEDLFKLESLDSALRKRIRTRITRGIVAGLVQKGWMIDYAPGNEGEFLRAVTNRGTSNEIVDGLLGAIVDIGPSIMAQELQAP